MDKRLASPSCLLPDDLRLWSNLLTPCPFEITDKRDKYSEPGHGMCGSVASPYQGLPSEHTPPGHNFVRNLPCQKCETSPSQAPSSSELSPGNMPTGDVVRGGFMSSVGRFHVSGVERVQGSCLMNMLLPRLTPEAVRARVSYILSPRGAGDGEGVVSYQPRSRHPKWQDYSEDYGEALVGRWR